MLQKNGSFAGYFINDNHKRRLQWLPGNPLVIDEGGRRKERGRNLCDWVKSTMIGTYCFYLGGYRIVTSQHFTW